MASSIRVLAKAIDPVEKECTRRYNIVICCRLTPLKNHPSALLGPIGSTRLVNYITHTHHTLTHTHTLVTHIDTHRLTHTHSHTLVSLTQCSHTHTLTHTQTHITHTLLAQEHNASTSDSRPFQPHHILVAIQWPAAHHVYSEQCSTSFLQTLRSIMHLNVMSLGYNISSIDSSLCAIILIKCST